MLLYRGALGQPGARAVDIHLRDLNLRCWHAPTARRYKCPEAMSRLREILLFVLFRVQDHLHNLVIPVEDCA